MGTDKEGAHSYADAYEWHFRHLRHRAITLLEIGVGGYRDSTSGGESLRMWSTTVAGFAFFGLGRYCY